MPIARTLAALSSATVALAAQAQTQIELPRERINLSASASTEVTRDVLGIGFSATKEGSDPAAVQTALKQALDTALEQARRVAKPGQVDVRTGGFSLSPRYAPKTGQINGWQGRAELLVEGKDTGAIAQLAGRITTMTVQHVDYSLSREAREKVEGEVTAQAIARYRAKAADYSRQFGYGGYVIGEVSVNSDEAGSRPSFKAVRAMAAPMADEALPTEAGKAIVTVTVSGSVQMTQDSMRR